MAKTNDMHEPLMHGAVSIWERTHGGWRTAQQVCLLRSAVSDMLPSGPRAAAAASAPSITLFSLFCAKRKYGPERERVRESVRQGVGAQVY